MWRIIRAALVCGFCLWPLSVCLQSSIVPFFQAPCCFNLSLIFQRFPLSLLFLRNTTCRTCLLPHLGWEWLGLLRGNQHVITAKARNFKACCLSAESRKCSRTLLPQSLVLRSSSSWPDGSWMSHPLVSAQPEMLPLLWLWLTRMWTHGRRCTNMCTPEGRRRAALLHTGATVEG